VSRLSVVVALPSFLSPDYLCLSMIGPYGRLCAGRRWLPIANYCELALQNSGGTTAARNGIDCGGRQRVVRKRGFKVCHLFQCVLPRFGVRVVLEVPGLGFGSTGRPARIGYDAERPFRGWNLRHIEILPRSGLKVTVNLWCECAVLMFGGAIADNPVRMGPNKLRYCQQLSA
jgi:hypothetical protein